MNARELQLPLFGGDAPELDASFRAVERIALEDGAWLEVARGWLRGHAALMKELVDTAAWREEDRTMYEKRVAVPRLFAVLGEGKRPPVVDAMRRALDARYATSFERVSVALYRNGADSVAWHGDYVARRMPDALVATVSLGSARKFLLRRKADVGLGGKSMALSLGWGDLLVMGGTCQRTYEHAIPKVARAEPRIALMYRPVWEEP